MAVDNEVSQGLVFLSLPLPVGTLEVVMKLRAVGAKEAPPINGG